MLTQFNQKHPGFLVSGSRAEVYPLLVGILVRKGDPKHIQRLFDFSRPGIAIMDVNGASELGLWEDLAGRKELLGALQHDIAVSVDNSAQVFSYETPNLSWTRGLRMNPGITD